MLIELFVDSNNTLRLAFFFVIKFFFLNSKYANFQTIPMNVSVRAEDFQRAR